MHQQKQRARAAWKGSGEKDIASRFQGLLEDGLKSEFFGYTALTGVGRVVALLDDDGLPVEALPSGSLATSLPIRRFLRRVRRPVRRHGTAHRSGWLGKCSTP